MKYGWIYYWGVAAAFLFFVLTIAAMLAYPGGRIGHPESVGYSFWLNFFSDLGRARTFAGGPKLLSYMLFSFAVICAGVTGVLYFAAFPEFFKRSNDRKLVQIGSLAGIVSSFCFVGIGMTPWDIYQKTHLACVYSGFTSLLITVLCYVPAMLRTNILPNFYAYTYASFAIVLAGYLGILFFGPRAADSGLAIQATGQKIVVYSQIVCMLIQSAGIIRILRNRA
ncbi:MAG: hypothetical protein K8S54_12995 [Spirochaetia bacterium]|nr:hypothetical protein [Spirochaetia bacterium]